MSMKSIRDYYGVPAKRGQLIYYKPSNGVMQAGNITSARGAYIRVKMLTGERLLLHPTWCIEYADHDEQVGNSFIEIKNRDHARELIAEAGITSDNVTKEQLSRLWHLLAIRLRNSGNYQGSYAMSKPVVTHFMECKTSEWKGREAISFNRDGFIGIAGWADSGNVQPILDGIADWVKMITLEETGANE